MKKTLPQINTHTRPNGEHVQLDHFLTTQACLSVTTSLPTRLFPLNSNHYLVQPTVHIRRAKTPKTTKHSKPTRKSPKEAIEKFNQQLQQTLTAPQPQPQPTSTADPDQLWEQLQHNLTASIAQHVPTIEHKAKQPWITNDMWTLTEARSKARQAQDTPQEQTLRKQIRKAARKDKATWLKEQLHYSLRAPTARENGHL